MEQSSKLIRKTFWILCLIISTNLLFVNCQTNNISKNHQYEKLNVGDSITKSGILIFDSKSGMAYFSENNTTSLSSKNKINKIIKDSKYLILLRKGLNTHSTSDYLTLSLCANDSRLIVNMKQLLFDRYAIIKLDNFVFYKINREYKDKKTRLIICEGE